MMKTDMVVLGLALLFFVSGWRKGLFRSIIGPLCLLISSIVAIIHYDVSHDPLKSFLIAVLGGFILSLVVKIIFFFANRTVDQNYRGTSFFISRFLGGILSLGWNGTWVALGLTLLPLVPWKAFGLPRVETDLKQSVSYNLVQLQLLKKVPQTKSLTTSLAVLQNPNRIQQLSSTPEYQDLFNDSKMQTYLTDSQVAEQLKNKDIVGLLSNPKTRQLLQDDLLMHKIDRLSQKVYEKDSKETPPKTP